jgi:hypothetical protein
MKWSNIPVSIDICGNNRIYKSKWWQTLNYLEPMTCFMDSMWTLWFNTEIEMKQSDLRTATVIVSTFCTLSHVIRELTVSESSNWYLIICLLGNPKKWSPFSQQFTRGIYAESNEWSPHLCNYFHLLLLPFLIVKCILPNPSPVMWETSVKPIQK